MKNLYSAIALLLFVNLNAQSPEFKRNFEDGNMKCKGKSYTLAIASFDKAIKVIAADAEKFVGDKSPATPERKSMSEAYAKRAACYFQTGNTSAMKTDAFMALSLDPENTDAKACIAASQHKGGDKIGACKEIRKQIIKGSEVAPKIFEECSCWMEGEKLAKDADTDANLKKYDAAMKKATDAIEILPDSGSTYAARAKAYLGLNQPEKALEDMNIAIAKKASSYKVYYVRAEIYMKAGKADSAVLDLNKCLEIKKDYYDGLLLRAQANEELQQWNAAIYDYKLLIKSRPDFGQNYYKCALAMEKHDDLLGACEMYGAAANRGVEEAKEMAANCASKKYMKQHLKSGN
jgi:tetratricopeptide (TPR) repeat protein